MEDKGESGHRDDAEDLCTHVFANRIVLVYMVSSSPL